MDAAMTAFVAVARHGAGLSSGSNRRQNIRG